MLQETQLKKEKEEQAEEKRRDEEEGEEKQEEEEEAMLRSIPQKAKCLALFPNRHPRKLPPLPDSFLRPYYLPSL